MGDSSKCACTGVSLEERAVQDLRQWALVEEGVELLRTAGYRAVAVRDLRSVCGDSGNPECSVGAALDALRGETNGGEGLLLLESSARLAHPGALQALLRSNVSVNTPSHCTQHASTLFSQMIHFLIIKQLTIRL